MQQQTIETLRQALQESALPFAQQEPLASHTTFQIGGAFKIHLQGKITEVFFDIYFDCHQIHLLVFIPFPDTILISATITKEISTITTTQKPAVP